MGIAIPTNSYTRVREVIPSGWTPASPDPLWGRTGRVVRVVIEGVEQIATVTTDSTMGVCKLFLPATGEYVEVEVEWAGRSTD